MERIYSPEISKIDSQTLPAQKKICQKQQKPNAQHFALLLVLLVIQEGLITNTLTSSDSAVCIFSSRGGSHTFSPDQEFAMMKSCYKWKNNSKGELTLKH